MRRRRKARRPAGKTALRITSMMDILTVLLLFLLKSFVADGEVSTPAPGVELPVSSSEERPKESLVVAISENDLRLGDVTIGAIDAVTGEGLLIAPLAAHLEDAREQQAELDRLRALPTSGSGSITIQGDREIPFRLLQKVMYTCQQSGYHDISLAVIRKS